MSLAKKICIAVGTVFVAIQFIQPNRNQSDKILSTDLSETVVISDSVLSILKNSCYDCHSNNTLYPVYMSVQPIGWFMKNHIDNGKEKLNFSEFGSYSTRKQISKLNGIANSVKDDIMPLDSYRLTHWNSRLDSSDKILLINWALNTKDSLMALY